MIFPILASIQLSDTDKKALIILLVILVIVFLLLGLLGMAIRATMHHQAKRADSMMHDVTVTHVVDNPRDFRRFGFQKNKRALYRDSLIPFGIAVLAMIIWTVYNIATEKWSDNIFANCSDLFFRFDWVGTKDNPVFVKVFGMSIISRWPDVTHSPEFQLEHLCSYIVVFLLIVSWVYYAYECQAFIARAYMIQRRSNEVFHKSLEGYNAAEDIKIKADKPLPPSD